MQVPLNKTQTVVVHVDNMSQAGPPGPQGETGDPGSSTIQVIAGAGLVGGGFLSADRTLDIGSGNGIIVSADKIDVDTAVIASISYADLEVTVASADPIANPIRNGIIWITVP